MRSKTTARRLRASAAGHFVSWATLLPGLVLAAPSAHAAPDVAVVKTVDNPAPVGNEPVEFTIQVTNVGDETAHEVVVSEQLPSELAIPPGMAAFPSIGSFDAATGEWTVGELAAGDTATLIVPAVVTAAERPACIVNAAAASAREDVNGDNDAARAVIRRDDLEHCVDLEVDYTIVTRGLFPSCDAQEPYWGFVNVINRGPDAARNVTVALSQMPVVAPNLRFTSAMCSGMPGSPCLVPMIESGASVSLAFRSDDFRSYAPTQQTFSFWATTSDKDYEPDNDSARISELSGGFSSCEVPTPDFGVPALFSGGGCFIATAAYGSPLDRRIDILRRLRDHHLLTNAPGRAFVEFYYAHSPPIADYIAERDWLRALVRGGLWPLVFALERPVAASSLAALGLLLVSVAGHGLRGASRRTILRRAFGWRLH